MIVEEKKAGEFNCCQRTKQTNKPCEGSRCMAWRWTYDKVPKVSDVQEAPDLPWFESVQSTTHGFCGLAGRP